MHLKEILERKVGELNDELDKKEIELKVLEKNLEKELKDVQKLKSLSFSNLMASILRNKDEKLEREEREYLEAKLKYDYLKTNVESLKDDIEKINKRLGDLINIEDGYKNLIEEKKELIKKFNLNVRDEILKIDEERNLLISEKTEVTEALREAHNCIEIGKIVKNSLDSAHNWGIYDILGGGMISSAIKHNRIDDAKRDIERLSYAAGILKKELGDVDSSLFNGELDISGFSYTFDIFFDNIFSDISVQSEVNRALDKVNDFISKVERLIIDLEERDGKIDIKINTLNYKLNEIIESVD
ncbi:hypothetical protein [Clostridium sp.]|uniref:hypothetical protein n=1 Tax=Clostridium sp. TaxID=1506 RepID=UPI0026287711|nr:hypothetical protein [Clostridium sp.]